jgi:hypothetical protein
MARIISAYTSRLRDPILEGRIAAARTFRIGQDVRAGNRYGKVKHIDFVQGIITIASGKRERRFAADFVQKND